MDYPTGLKVVDFGGVAGEVINQSGFVLKDAQAALGAAGNGVQVPKAGIYRLTYSAVANPNQVVAAPQFILISYMVPSWTGTPSPTQQSETNPLPPIPSGEDFGPLLEDSFIWPVPAGGGFAVAAFNLGSGTVTLSGQGARIEIEKLSD